MAYFRKNWSRALLMARDRIVPHEATDFPLSAVVFPVNMALFAAPDRCSRPVAFPVIARSPRQAKSDVLFKECLP